MPRTTFSPDNKEENPFDYPKLSLDRGERARIVVIEAPMFEYVHSLRAPQIINGAAVMETVQRGGETVEQPKYDFIGRYICIGDYGTIGDKGSDPDTCPVCRAASDSDAVRPPDRRYAMHIVRYQTKPGSFDLAEPYMVRCLGWSYTGRIFNMLVDFQQEWGDLKQHDLMLGPCESKQYQKFDINVSGRAEWLASEERKKLTAKVYKENQAPDLAVLIGRKGGAQKLISAVNEVLERHRLAFGGPAPQDTADEVSANVGLDELLDETSSKTTDSSDDTGTSVDESANDEADASEEPEISESSESDESGGGGGGEKLDFDDLLSSV